MTTGGSPGHHQAVGLDTSLEHFKLESPLASKWGMGVIGIIFLSKAALGETNGNDMN